MNPQPQNEKAINQINMKRQQQQNNHQGQNNQNQNQNQIPIPYQPVPPHIFNNPSIYQQYAESNPQNYFSPNPNPVFQQHQPQQFNHVQQPQGQPLPSLPPSQPILYPYSQAPPQMQPQQLPPQQQISPENNTNSKKRSNNRATATYPRKRALTACDTCRLKKIKCDNERPRCGSCIRNGNINCHYRTDEKAAYSSYDPASLNILGKLDIILKDLKDIKGGKSSDQLYLQHCSPLLAFREIVIASQNIMYYLRKKSPRIEVLDRLFWTCLKLECELLTELSPFGCVSGITQIEPPISFPKIPESTKRNYSESVLNLASRYDDEYTWYYFLTEIAIRKIDNKMFDEMFSLDSQLKKLWDQESFSSEIIWHNFIKYLNQYNGIINSLSPEIRNFVLEETDVDLIYRRIKEKFDKKNNIKEEFSMFLDDFLIDDDLLIKTQSQSIMFIKTRVLSSKLLLFRPIVYLFLEDKIKIEDILEAINSIFESTNSTATNSNTSHLGTPNSFNSINLSSSSDNFEFDMDYYNLINAPLFYQKQFPNEDFSNLIEYENENDKSTNNFKIKDLAEVKKKVIKIFIQNVISLPKLNIPKLAAYRHPGSWYYLRNLFIGNIYQYLLYKKIESMLKLSNVSAEVEKMMSMVIDKQSLIVGFEHSILVYEYWKDESKDCAIYQDYIKKMIASL
ncbi:unnamed protein product [Candida verbasci]|uniref:Zn(2)-C6 fungal-type domain-containing protein n=1 Tax=Candida verbasci TaxID=1227364 RepID=A0A9W4TXK8_9ASCO|nr:unnamed protein product [Candida verbasci]